MIRQDLVGGRIYDAKVMSEFRLESVTLDATAEMQLLVSFPPVIYLDPAGGAKTVLLPAEASSAGLTFWVRNIADAAEVLTIEEDSSTTTIVALAQDEGCMLHCDGTTWRAFQTDIA